MHRFLRSVATHHGSGTAKMCRSVLSGMCALAARHCAEFLDAPGSEPIHRVAPYGVHLQFAVGPPAQTGFGTCRTAWSWTLASLQARCVPPVGRRGTPRSADHCIEAVEWLIGTERQGSHAGPPRESRSAHDSASLALDKAATKPPTNASPRPIVVGRSGWSRNVGTQHTAAVLLSSPTANA
jgi:hypothetical protein